MSKISINRTSEFNNRARNYGLYIDSKKVDAISNGQTKEYEIEPGKHEIYFKIDWCSSQTLLFELKENETKIFKVGSFKYGKYLTPIMGIILILHFILLSTIQFGYLIFLIFPIGLYPLYFISFGRNKYLTLKEFTDDWTKL